MKIDNIYLALGLILSIVLFTFRFDNGIDLLGIKLEYSIIDVALYESDEAYLNSMIFGYLFYIIFGLRVWNKTKGNDKFLILVFFLLAFTGVLFELIAFLDSFKGVYNGTHFRVGILLAILGLLPQMKFLKTN